MGISKPGPALTLTEGHHQQNFLTQMCAYIHISRLNTCPFVDNRSKFTVQHSWDTLHINRQGLQTAEKRHGVPCQHTLIKFCSKFSIVDAY